MLFLTTCPQNTLPCNLFKPFFSLVILLGMWLENKRWQLHTYKRKPPCKHTNIRHIGMGIIHSVKHTQSNTICWFWSGCNTLIHEDKILNLNIWKAPYIHHYPYKIRRRRPATIMHILLKWYRNYVYL
jgi:hypothetical protein